MTQIKVGKDVEAVCRKCGEVWHVVVTMDDGVITKVQCKECMGYHRYKPPVGEARVDAKPTSRRVVGSGSSKSRAAASKKRATRKIDTPLIEPDLSRPVRGYSIREAYTPGDRIEHPKFGEGVVEAVPDPGKMSVFFEDGRRTLAHQREP